MRNEEGGRKMLDFFQGFMYPNNNITYTDTHTATYMGG